MVNLLKVVYVKGTFEMTHCVDFLRKEGSFIQTARKINQYLFLIYYVIFLG